MGCSRMELDVHCSQPAYDHVSQTDSSLSGVSAVSYDKQQQRVDRSDMWEMDVASRA